MIHHPNETEYNPGGRLSIEFTLNDFFKDEYTISCLKQFSTQFCITAHQLWENLELKTNKHNPPLVHKTPEDVALHYQNSKVKFLNKPLNILQNLCLYQSLELYHDPCLRKYLLTLCKDHVRITTEPTFKGKTLDIYNPLYVAKRLVSVPFRNITDELWLLIMESEKKGLIRVKFHYPWSNEGIDQIYQRLGKYYLGPDNHEYIGKYL